MGVKQPVQNEEELFKKHKPFVHYIVNKMNHDYYEYEELIQIGYFGLLKAIRTFNESKGINFSTYASRCITNEIYMNHRNNKKHKNTVSLNHELFNNNHEKFELHEMLQDFNANETPAVESKMVIMQNMAKLNDLERSILAFKLKELTQEEMGKELNLSQSYISRIEKRALQKLSRNLNTCEEGYFMGRGTGRRFIVGPRKVTANDTDPSPVVTYNLSPEELEKYKLTKDGDLWL